MYGAIGVTVCERWNDFENFYQDMGPKPDKSYSIDRWPNPHGNYEPGNCRWATPTEQARNKRNSIYITINGERRLLSEVAQEMGLKYGVAYFRFGLATKQPTKKSLIHLLSPEPIDNG